MYLADYHTHSKLSPDGCAPLRQLAQAAVFAGLNELCVTDHYDLITAYGSRSEDYDWAPALRQMEETVHEFSGKLTLKLGCEFGSGHLDLARSRDFLALPQLDFVIGSLHNRSPKTGGEDLYCGDYTSEDFCYETLDDYFSTMEDFVQHPQCYDVLGHFIYPRRYMMRDGQQHISFRRYAPRIDEILRRVAADGKGIELNTFCGQSVEEWTPVLQRFLALGGERITLGSDAHAPDTVGAGIRAGQALLKSLGYR
ncbi:MAG: histidinol-phosphatase HisJ family protein, partial [Oscillospiraceae bacterium]